MGILQKIATAGKKWKIVKNGVFVKMGDLEETVILTDMVKNVKKWDNLTECQYMSKCQYLVILGVYICGKRSRSAVFTV